jgi:hypothetical protein
METASSAELGRILLFPIYAGFIMANARNQQSWTGRERVYSHPPNQSQRFYGLKCYFLENYIDAKA